MTRDTRSRHAEIAQLLNAIRTGVIKDGGLGLTADPTFVEAADRVGCDCPACRGMTRAEAEKWIRENEGKVFQIRFVKRTTGELREMTCKTGVTEYLAGAEPKYDARKKGLINVFDTEKNWYRSIPVEGITAIRRPGDEDWVEVTKEESKP